MGKSVPIVYAYFHRKFYDKLNGSNCLSLKDAKAIISRYKIPSIIIYPTLQEMEYYGLIKINHTKGVEIIKPNYIFERDKNRTVANFMLQG